MKDYS